MLAFLRDRLDLDLHDTKGRRICGWRELARGVMSEAANLNASQFQKLDDMLAQTIPAAAAGGTADAEIATMWQQAIEAGATAKSMPPGQHWSTWSSSCSLLSARGSGASDGTDSAGRCYSDACQDMMTIPNEIRRCQETR